MPAQSTYNDKHFEQCLENFGRYCKIFYNSSLCITTNEKNDSYDENVTAKFILQAFDLYVIGSSETASDVESKKIFLSSPNIQLNYASLLSCGLMLSDSDAFHFSEIPSNILLKYIQMRDSQRRIAHLAQMIRRADMLKDSIMYFEKKTIQSSDEGESTTLFFCGDMESMQLENQNESLKLIATRRCHLKRIKTTLRRFVSLYKCHIGSHSFLAGILQLLQTQLSQDGLQILLWTFNGTILSENSLSTGSTSDESSGYNNADQYVRDAIELLLSFMVRIPEAEASSDVEAGDAGNNEDSRKPKISDHHESFLTFYINPTMSNYTLKCLKDELPLLKNLHAKPTGKISITNQKESRTELALFRSNIKGELDKHNMLGHMLRLTCTIL